MNMKAVRNRREDLTRNMEKAAGKDGNRDDSDSGVRSGGKTGSSVRRDLKNVIEESLDYVECPYDAEVNVLLTDNAGIHQINLDMRGIDNPTDVLSFPMCDFETPGDFSHLEETPEEYFDPDTGNYLWGIS